MKRLKIGIVGCGTIGREIAKACRGRLKNRIELIGVCDIDEDKARTLNKALKKKVQILKLDDLMKSSDLVVEAASSKASSGVIEKAIRHRVDILVMSTGGLLGKEGLLRRAETRGIRVYMPSGAICGIDGLKGASVGRIDSVTLTTRKPPKGLAGAPYLKKNSINLRDIKTESVLFEGSAKDAVIGFPQNVNVSAVLSLAGIGAKDTRVRIITSPDYTKNIHEVEITGGFGRIKTMTENAPSETNPKTSALAILSAIATLDGITKSVRIGT